MSYKVGTEVLSFCGSCKMDLGHTIIAITQSKIQKCQCRTCKAIHGYRTPRGVTDPVKYKTAIEKSKSLSSDESSTPGRKARSAKEIITHDAHWEKVMNQHKNTPAVPYHAKTQFKVGSIIQHPTFGDGYIEKLIHPNKVEVVFKMETKVLIHGSTHPSSTGFSPKPPTSKSISEN